MASEFARYMRPLIDALKELGNSGSFPEVKDTIAKNMNLTDAQLEERHKSGQTRFGKHVGWARYYLAKEGYIELSTGGVWSLTEKGIRSNISSQEAQEIVKSVSRKSHQDRLDKNSPNIMDDDEDADDDESTPPSDSGDSQIGNHRTELLEIMRQMSPSSFEKLCQRFLRESGFQQVEVTGKTGDGGIDGRGLLQVNPLMSIHVLFQCKRYAGSVSSEAIRNFRGAMTGRTDKGIFITTGNFTRDAQREAIREGVPPIELVDAEKLLTMFEELQLGLIPKTIYEVNRELNGTYIW